MKCLINVRVVYLGTHGRGTAILLHDGDWPCTPAAGQCCELPFNDEHAGLGTVERVTVISDGTVLQATLRKFALHTPDFCNVAMEHVLEELPDELQAQLTGAPGPVVHAMVCGWLERQDFITALQYIRDKDWYPHGVTWVGFQPMESVDIDEDEDDDEAAPIAPPTIPGDHRLN